MYIAVTPPDAGLLYIAICSHGRSQMHFTPVETEALAGTEKVHRLNTAHRRQTQCVCLGEAPTGGAIGPT